MKLQNIFIESLQSLPNKEESKRDINKNEAEITDILNEDSYDNHENSQNNIKGNFLNNDNFKDKLTNDSNNNNKNINNRNEVEVEEEEDEDFNNVFISSDKDSNDEITFQFQKL
jgi:hypothetical protein